MQPFEFSLGIGGSEIIQEPVTQCPALKCELSRKYELSRRPETIPGQLLSSSASFRFVSGIKCKPISGLGTICKPIGGLTIKTVNLF